MAQTRPSSPEAPKLSDIPRGVWLIAGTVVLGSFMSQLDTSVVNVGLQGITKSLNSNLATTQWIASGYLLALGASIPLTSWMVRKHGGRRVWLCAIVAFSVASLLCALAQTADQLIALRILQGIAGGMLLPTGQILAAQAAGPERMGRVMSTTGIVVVLAPVLGPVLGGLLIEASWRWLFLINVPVGVIAFVLGFRLLPRGGAEPTPPLDVPGLILISVGLPSAIYAITEAGNSQSITKTSVVVTALVAIAALAAFARRELRVPAPLLNVRILGNRMFASSMITSTFASAALFGILILTPLYLEIERGYSPIHTGLLMIGTGIGSAFFFPVSGRLTDRFGGGPVSACGLVLCLITTAPMAVMPADASMVIVEIVLALSGIAFTVGLLPTMAAAYASVTREQLPDATPMIVIATRIGGSIGTAIVVVILESRLKSGELPVDAFHAAFRGAMIAVVVAMVPAIILARGQLAGRGKAAASPMPAPVDA
jgi:EmrB/QacA subfamily drug resistance transporter